MSLSPSVSCENGEWAGSGQTRVGPKYHVLDGVQIRSPTRAGLLCKYVRLSCVFYCKLAYLLIRLCDICRITLDACSFSTSVRRTGSAHLQVANRWRAYLHSSQFVFLFVFRTDSTDFPDCLPILLSMSVFYSLVFPFPPLFSCWFRAVD